MNCIWLRFSSLAINLPGIMPPFVIAKTRSYFLCDLCIAFTTFSTNISTSCQVQYCLRLFELSSLICALFNLVMLNLTFNYFKISQDSDILLILEITFNCMYIIKLTLTIFVVILNTFSNIPNFTSLLLRQENSSSTDLSQCLWIASKMYKCILVDSISIASIFWHNI